MKDPRVEKLAHTLVNYSVKIKPGDWVIIFADKNAEPLAEEVLRHVLRAGGHPSTLMGTDRMTEIFLQEANKEQLKHITPFQRMPYADADAFIALQATDNTRILSNADTEKQQIRGAAFKEIQKIYMDRSAAGELRWTLTQFPCHALAQEADMSLSEFEDFVYKATFSDQDDPIREWQKLYDRQEKLVNWLDGRKQVELHGPNIDISLSIEGRNFINSGGTHNMPSGEVFTSPVEDSLEGRVDFTYPAIRLGREVDGIHLEFEKGKVIKATAKKNEDYLLKMLDLDENARTIGELGIGTNFGIDRFTKSILYDEKIGGTIHLAVGAGFPEAGGKNESALHWDMICDMRKDSEIKVDGELFYKNAEFQV